MNPDCPGWRKTIRKCNTFVRLAFAIFPTTVFALPCVVGVQEGDCSEPETGPWVYTVQYNRSGASCGQNPFSSETEATQALSACWLEAYCDCVFPNNAWSTTTTTIFGLPSQQKKAFDPTNCTGPKQSPYPSVGLLFRRTLPGGFQRG